MFILKRTLVLTKLAEARRKKRSKMVGQLKITIVYVLTVETLFLIDYSEPETKCYHMVCYIWSQVSIVNSIQKVL